MTGPQTKHYWRLWSAVVRLHDWRMVAGRLAGVRLVSFGAEAVNILYQRIWDTAELQQTEGPLLADDMRHACHAVALGKNKSSRDLNNRDLDKIFALFKLLADPDDLDALLALQNPETAERTRLVHGIRAAAPFPYIDALCRDRFASQYESPYFEDLAIDQLRQLHVTLKARSAASNLYEQKIVHLSTFGAAGEKP